MQQTPAPPPKILASAATGIVELIERNRGDADAILGRAGVRANDLDSPLNEINLQQFCDIFEYGARQVGNDNFGLDFGRRFMPRHLGALGYIAIAAPTLAAALRALVDYFPAHQGRSGLSLIRESGIYWLSYRIFDERIVHRRQDAELSLAVFINIFRAALGPDWTPLEVRFEHTRPDNWKHHERIFGAPVQFGSRTNAFAFRPGVLSTIMPESDPFLSLVMTPLLERRGREQAHSEDFAAMVRNEIKMQLGETLPCLAEIARVLGVSEAAFDKQLNAHGVLFPDLVRAARQELALHFVADTDMPLTEIAYRLGYSELSAFSRAFRNWTGMPARDYRRSGAGAKTGFG